jgi:peptidoglycan/xylan/chitin deacetylase (PgdA/CDA1 family)
MIELFCDSQDESALKKFRYVIFTLLNVCGIDKDNEISIFYGNRPNALYDISVINEPGASASNVPESHVVISEDIIAKSFELLVCGEEYGSQRDDKNRFLGKFSNRDSLLKPVVNYYGLVLRKAIEQAAAYKGITVENSERPFTVVLSHDVDNVTDKIPYIVLHRINKGFRLIKKRQLKKGLKQLLFTMKSIFSFYNCYWDFKEVTAMEEHYGCRSTFFFINGKGGRFGARYKLKYVGDIIRYLEENSFEVALHTNYYSYDNIARIRHEKEAIKKITKKAVAGCRNHYLRFEVPFTWWNLKEAGLKYDSTLGYTDLPGFRAGVAYPFYPFDPIKNKIIDILEIPMPIMDSAVFEPMEDKEAAWEKIAGILEETRKVGGTIAINFHSEVFYEKDFPGRKEIYERILQYIKENNGRGIPAREILENIESLEF